MKDQFLIIIDRIFGVGGLLSTRYSNRGTWNQQFENACYTYRTQLSTYLIFHEMDGPHNGSSGWHSKSQIVMRVTMLYYVSNKQLLFIRYIIQRKQKRHIVTYQLLHYSKLKKQIVTIRCNIRKVSVILALISGSNPLQLET